MYDYKEEVQKMKEEIQTLEKEQQSFAMEIMQTLKIQNKRI